MKSVHSKKAAPPSRKKAGPESRRKAALRLHDLRDYRRSKEVAFIIFDYGLAPNPSAVVGNARANWNHGHGGPGPVGLREGNP